MITVLAPDVVNKIAAGEVIERPASVVRELVDNAVDAGATNIEIRLERGGQALIAVTDNGSGMSHSDALLAFERHATSKISSADELVGLRSLGFRGEALPSIASVAKVTLRTRVGEAAFGTEVVIDGGEAPQVKEVSHAPGTSIQVRQLFFNTPARRKFLKSDRAEYERVRLWLLHFSVAHPEIHFRLFHDGKEILNLPAAASRKRRAEETFKAVLHPGVTTEGPVEVSVAVGPPLTGRSDANHFVLLVNGRLINDRALLRAARDGYLSMLKDREFPVGFIAIELPGSEVDINVHPQKSEVRFAHSGWLYTLVKAAVSEALRVVRVPEVSALDFAERGSGTGFYYSAAAPSTFNSGFQTQVGFGFGEAEYSFKESGERVELPAFSKLRYLGQALQCYLLGEYDQTIYVVDMHAAHERINYNLIRRSFVGGGRASQELLFPLQLTLSPLEVEVLAREEHCIQELGFKLEPLGADSIVVRAVPGVLASGNVRGMITEMAALLVADSSAAEVRRGVETRLDEIAARLACHASIRSGQQLSREQVYELFAQLDDSDFGQACPHGRPVMIALSEGELERRFGRA